MRRLTPSVLLTKHIPVLPSPCKMLESVASRYKKGQMNERMRIKSPASLLWNRYSPSRGP